MSARSPVHASKVLELGCGPQKRPGAIALDISPHSAADVICDLDIQPYPFRDSIFDEIVCEHVLEHLKDLVRVMEELHRIARPGALVKVFAPYFSSIFYYRDPTHRCFFSAHTFDYFVPGTPVHSFRYSSAEFAQRTVEFPITPGAGPLKILMFRLINRHIDFYEHHLAFVLPRHLIYYELEVLKPEVSEG